MQTGRGVAHNMQAQVMQRLRIIYGAQGPLSYVSVLDLGRLWERLLHRARIPLVYSQGFNPHPRMQFAAALAVGYTSNYEVLDIWCSAELSPAEVTNALTNQCPQGLTIKTIQVVPLKAASPQASLQTLSYRLEIVSVFTEAQVRTAVATLVQSPSLVFDRTRKGIAKPFDMRPLITTLEYTGWVDNAHLLQCTLQFRAEGSIRPEEVVTAMQIPVIKLDIHRTGMTWRDDLQEA